MKRLRIDELTHKILGYEDVNKYLRTYQDDILVEEASMADIGSYYEDGRMIKEEREDYHAGLGRLQAALQAQEEKLADEEGRVIQAILEDDSEKTKADIKAARAAALKKLLS